VSRTVTIPRSVLVGGPLDGETISAGQDATFLWVQLSGKGAPRCYAKQARGRHLYRLVHKVRPYKYLYAGHTHVVCPSCGGYAESPDPVPEDSTCGLCGGSLNQP